MYQCLIKFIRAFPQGLRGKTRLARWLLRRYLDGGETEIIDKIGLRFAVPDLHEPVAFHLLIDGVYEPELRQFLTAQLKPGETFVDVGANVGVFTLPMARHVGESGKVLAVEASPRVFSYLSRNVASVGLANIICRRAAVCERDGEVRFFDAPPVKFGMGSMANRFEGQSVAVEGRTLDRLTREAGISPVSVIKVDVEGFELGVFQGAQAILTGDQPPLVVFEFCDWAECGSVGGQPGAAQQFLMELGYSIWTLKDFTSGGAALQEPLTAGFYTLVALRGRPCNKR